MEERGGLLVGVEQVAAERRAGRARRSRRLRQGRGWLGDGRGRCRNGGSPLGRGRLGAGRWVGQLSVRARQRGGRPHPPNRGGTAEFGQENLGVSRASRSVEHHRRLRGRTAPGLAEGSPGAGVAGEPVSARRTSPLASPGTGGLVATWNVAVVSHGSPLVVVMAPIENKPIRSEFGHRFSRSSACRVDGHAPPPEEPGVRGRKSTKDLRGSRVRVPGGQGSARVTTYEPAAGGRSATNFLRPLLARGCRLRAPRRERTVHRGVVFVMGAHDRPTARQRTGMRPRSVREVKGSSKIFFSPRRPGQRVDSAPRPTIGPVPGRRITSGPGGKTPDYRWAP